MTFGFPVSQDFCFLGFLFPRISVSQEFCYLGFLFPRFSVSQISVSQEFCFLGIMSQEFCFLGIMFLRNSSSQKFCFLGILFPRNSVSQNFCLLGFLFPRNSVFQEFCFLGILPTSSFSLVYERSSIMEGARRPMRSRLCFKLGSTVGWGRLRCPPPPQQHITLVLVCRWCPEQIMQRRHCIRLLVPPWLLPGNLLDLDCYLNFTLQTRSYAQVCVVVYSEESMLAMSFRLGSFNNPTCLRGVDFCFKRTVA